MFISLYDKYQSYFIILANKNKTKNQIQLQDKTCTNKNRITHIHTVIEQKWDKSAQNGGIMCKAGKIMNRWWNKQTKKLKYKNSHSMLSLVSLFVLRVFFHSAPFTFHSANIQVKMHINNNKIRLNNESVEMKSALVFSFYLSAFCEWKNLESHESRKTSKENVVWKKNRWNHFEIHVHIYSEY